MKKLLLLLVVSIAVSAPASSFANEDGRSISEVIAEVETNANAKCEYTKSSIGFQVMLYRWEKKYYTCIGVDGTFDIALKIKQTGEYDRFGNVVFSKTEVRKVIYY